MDKCIYLKVTNGIRKERWSRTSQRKNHQLFHPEKEIVDRFCDLAKTLSDSELKALLGSLKASLEKERRRSAGRKQNYDPGRHISLYLAVKTLVQNAKPPA